MRDIKFRCYVKFLGEMHEVRELILDKGTVMIEVYPYGLDRDDAPIMQYIGMKDKNGVDIYEGDIVQFNVREDKRTPESLPYYNEKGAVEISFGSVGFGGWDSAYCTDDSSIEAVNEYLIENNIKAKYMEEVSEAASQTF